VNLAARQREAVARLLSGRAEAGEAVHAANIRATLTETLRTSFPVTEALVGRDYFRGLAVAFLTAHPPTRPVLAEYGAALPGFLENHAVARDLPYLADLARLEWARQAAYFAPDSEAVRAESVAALADTERLTLRLARRPGTTMLRSGHPVFAIWAAHQPGGPPLESIDPAGPGESGAVYRDAGAVGHLPLDEAGEALLGEFDGTAALGAILKVLGGRSWAGRSGQAALGAALALLLRKGLLAS
jgi:hypothetical protein